MIRNAKDLSPDQKLAIESLLGRRIQEDEAISVRAIEPPVLSDQRRRELAEELRAYFAEIDARRNPGSPEEAEEILTGHPEQPARLSSPAVKIVLDTTRLVRANEHSHRPPANC